MIHFRLYKNVWSIARVLQYIAIWQYIDTFIMYRDMILWVSYHDTAGNVLTHKINKFCSSHIKILWINLQSYKSEIKNLNSCIKLGSCINITNLNCNIIKTCNCYVL